MKNNILVFGTKNFNSSFNEIKEFLNFPLIFYDKNSFSEISIKTINSLLIDSEICNDLDILSSINNMPDMPLLLLKGSKISSPAKLICNNTATLPLSLIEISNALTKSITSKTFIQNSSVKIKDYVVDKNERKLKKKNLSITITEREIQLIELLAHSQKPLSKSTILKKVWKYADDTDTHTIETHIYRLRKKILIKFKDKNFIINTKVGY
jgi:hypothetical protein